MADLEKKRMDRVVTQLLEEKREWERLYNEEMASKMDKEKEQYEYEIIHILPGGGVWSDILNGLGEKGYRLVAVVPLTQVIYNDGQPSYTGSGTDLIFERRKEIE